MIFYSRLAEVATYLRVLVLALALCCVSAGGSWSESAAKSASLGPVLVDEAGKLGVDFVHESGAIGRMLLPEIMGSGVALFDYDRDGDLDLYLVQGGELLASADARQLVPQSARKVKDRLFRNELVTKDGVGVPGTLRFVDVTSEVKLDSRGYGLGVAVGDANGDGWLDLYLANLDANALWINRGGTFERTDAGVEDPRWSSSAAFFDAEGDGDLDLYVANYAIWSVAGAVTCFAPNSRRDYCGPQSYPAAPDSFYLNDGSGRFSQTGSAAILAAEGSGLGVVAFDATGDGQSEVLVANDGMPNWLWHRRGDRWTDEGLLSGLAVNGSGSPEASMGIAVGDVDSDGDEDVFFTHLSAETDTLLLNQGSGLFADRTVASGLARMTLPKTSFGTALVDLDADGDLDLAAVSGAVRLGVASGASGTTALGQENLLLRNEGLSANGVPRFEPWPASAAPAFSKRRVSRGLAVGDLDNDGDADLVVTNIDGPAEIFINQTDPKQWLGFVSLSATSQYQGIQAHGLVVRRSAGDIGSAGGVMFSRTDGSYLSASDPRIRIYSVVAGSSLQISTSTGDAAEAASATFKIGVEHIGRYVLWPARE